MGIDIYSKNDKAQYKSSYTTYYHLRSIIAHAYHPIIGNLFDKREKFTDEEIKLWNSVCDDDLDLLLLHSDCDGELKPDESKRILSALKRLDVDFSEMDFMYKRLYEDLLAVIKYSASHRVKLYFS